MLIGVRTGRMCAASLSFVVRYMLDSSRFVKAHGEWAPNHLDRFVPSFVVRQMTVSVKHLEQRPVRDEVPEMLTARERALVSQIYYMSQYYLMHCGGSRIRTDHAASFFWTSLRARLSHTRLRLRDSLNVRKLRRLSFQLV